MLKIENVIKITLNSMMWISAVEMFMDEKI